MTCDELPAHGAVFLAKASDLGETGLVGAVQQSQVLTFA